MDTALLASLSSHFTWIDWGVLFGFLAFTTWVGAFFAGKQANIREFFLAGRKLPWPAVSGSIIATEISAVTLISVPAIVYKPGGNLTYLQLMLGALAARAIIGFVFVRAFYEREIYSPYDYIGARLGEPVRKLTTALFVLNTVLGQSVRLLTTALVLELITDIPLSASIWVMGGVSILWSLPGGISSVILTDVVQFAIFTLALIASASYIIFQLPGGVSETIDVCEKAGKLKLLDLSTDPKAAYTLWTALIGNTLLCLNAYGTDQMIAQRMFCCRGPREARLAILSSSVALAIAVLGAFVGLGLYAYFERNPLTGDAAELVRERNDRIFPVFVLQNMPVGMVGLIIAAIFTAASAAAALTALSQTILTAFAGLTARDDASHSRRMLMMSRLLIVAAGVVLCGMAELSKLALDHYGQILDLALAMATYTGGSILAAFLISVWRIDVDHTGICWGAPLSVLTVFGITWHDDWAQWITIVGAGTIGGVWIVNRSANWRPRDAVRSAVLALFTGLPVLLCCVELPAGNGASGFALVAWPWNVPIGLTVTLTLGIALARRRACSGIGMK